MAPFPEPDAPPVICIQLTSLVALQPQPVPVVTMTRPSLASGPAAAEVAESVRLACDPSCAIAKTGGVGSPVLIVMLPLRPATQVLAAIGNEMVASAGARAF